MRIVILGDPLSGKSTLAAHLALALAKIRKTQASPTVVLTSPSTAYALHPVNVERAATLNKMLCIVKASAEAPLIIDDQSEFYSSLLASWRKQTAEQRERRGLSPKVQMTPAEWQVVNSKFASVREAIGEKFGVDVIEIYRRSGVYLADPDLGMIEGEGDGTRGFAQAGAGADLVIRLGGGLRDRNLQPGWRVLRVLSDSSQRIVGRELSLPRLNGHSDRMKLDRELSSLFKEPLKQLIRVGDAEAEAWRRSREVEPPDSWPEAREQGERAEAAVLASELKALLEIHGLSGQKAEAKQLRAQILYQAFGVADVDTLGEVPVEILRGKAPWARRAIENWRMPQSAEQAG